ncbi:glucan endo-1,3-beta-glucosidase, acidic isoform [Lolium perenne]|uniref:glucan endo-1,3-beta-glucosidase, acidic isoform n=1 Tax=Lolium perenne TaxID=4522 RepID=UPI0021EABBAA|nr:glucan endo-1,3-beta-glucosidase, acidic isoform-like [Lolium perenne]
MAEHRAAAYMFAVAMVLGVLAAIPAAVQSIGVCYGVNGDGLPTASDVVELYKSNGITGMRVYTVNDDTLQALSGSNLGLILDTGNKQLPELAANATYAAAWVKANIQSHQGLTIKYIAVGNEVPGQGGNPRDILPAMKNIRNALDRAGLGGIKVSTAVNSAVTQGFPPSKGIFNASASHMPPIAQYLASTGAPLLANIYPYFSYKGDTTHITLDYALFSSTTTVVTDDNGNQYQNLFDALVDTMYSALESAGAETVPIVVSESGWPSAGDGTVATMKNAQMYNQYLINHVEKGTPKRPGDIETYIFAMFNENNKNEGEETEKHFGLFNPDQSPAYPIIFA